MSLRAVEVPGGSSVGVAMTVIGHASVVSSLTTEFPPAALLWGPKSVGKWTAAEHVCVQHKISEPDLLRVRRLGMAEARDVVFFAQRAAAGGRGRACIIRLDGATPNAVDVLLKSVEDAGSALHFLLVTSGTVPQTLRDRCRAYIFGLLSTEEVEAVLVARGLSVAAARKVATQSGGRVKAALAALNVAEDKTLVLAALRALREADLAALEALADRWRDEHTELLVRWASECVSQRWRTFNEAETGLETALALRVLTALRQDVRPRLVVRATLTDVLRVQHRLV